MPADPRHCTGKTWPPIREKEVRAEERGEGKGGVPRMGNRSSEEALIGGKISDKKSEKTRKPATQSALWSSLNKKRASQFS